jgi:hypothetical protein
MSDMCRLAIGCLFIHVDHHLGWVVIASSRRGRIDDLSGVDGSTLFARTIYDVAVEVDTHP